MLTSDSILSVFVEFQLVVATALTVAPTMFFL